jgi:hypothetical protein
MWTEERRKKQAEVMKRVRAKYFPDPENWKKWHEKNSQGNKIAGKKMIGRKRPECGHASWNTGLTNETSLLVAETSRKRSRPRPEQACKNIAAACANRKERNPEWYEKICKINRKNAEAKRGVPRSVETMRKIMNLRKPTSIERQFLDLIQKYNLPYKYVGDGKFWIGNANPDFIRTDRSQREVVELYGDCWHRNHNPQDRIDKFAKSNFRCTVIWGREFKKPGWEIATLEVLGFRDRADVAVAT